MVRISSANYEHSCTLDTIFHQRLNVDVSKMQTLLLLLEDNPRLDTRTLRPLLEKYLPHHKGVDGTFVANF